MPLPAYEDSHLEYELGQTSSQASNNHGAGAEDTESGHDLVDSRMDQRMKDTKASVSPSRIDGVWVAVADQCQRQRNGVLRE